jgi:predicted nucleotidyltransferase
MEIKKLSLEEKYRIFENYKEYIIDIKKFLENKISNFKIFVFGSVVRKDYVLGLSDIDIAVVSNEFNDRNKRKTIDSLLFEKYFSYPYEFHLLTEEQWEFYKRFIDKFEEI